MEQMISRGTAGFETWTHVAALSLLRMGFYESYLVGKGSRRYGRSQLYHKGERLRWDFILLLFISS